MEADNEIDRIKKDTYSYAGWIVSDSFIKRTLAITGYVLLAHFILFSGLFLLGFVFGTWPY